MNLSCSLLVVPKFVARRAILRYFTKTTTHNMLDKKHKLSNIPHFIHDSKKSKTEVKTVSSEAMQADDLNELLSDSEGWDNEIEVTKVLEEKKQTQRAPIGMDTWGSSDDDEDILLLAQENAEQQRKLAGAKDGVPIFSIPTPYNPKFASTSTMLKISPSAMQSTQPSFLLTSSGPAPPPPKKVRTFQSQAQAVTNSQQTHIPHITSTSEKTTTLLKELRIKPPQENCLSPPGSPDRNNGQLEQEGDLQKKTGEGGITPKQETLLEEIGRSIDLSSDSISLEITDVKRPALRKANHELVFLTQKPSINHESSKKEACQSEKCGSIDPVSALQKKQVQAVVLSEEQEHVIDLARRGLNIFYTGSAGTGKSVLLRVLIKTLKNIYGTGGVAVTASTGLAACNIGGITVHSFAGVGLAKGEAQNLLKKVKRSRKHVQRWQNIGALVVDEISMIDGDLLDKLNYVAQKLRKNKKPFGGIQVIFCGDFFQLPPVTKDPEKSTKFAFDSQAWKESIDATIMLERVFRQQGDSKFIEMLNEMRLGKISEDTELEFRKLARPLPNDDIIPAELYSTRTEVDRANGFRLRNLPGRSHTYNAIDGGALEDDDLKDKLLANFLAPKELQLKIGAQVMMIKNIDETLVNGSLGKVIDFIDQDTYLFYETVCADPFASHGDLDDARTRLDMTKFRYNEDEDQNNATSIRKKGFKDQFCKRDPAEPIEKLGDTIFDFLKDGADSQDSEVQANIERKKKLLEDLHQSSKSGRKLPLVRFLTPDGSSRCVLVQPEDWAIEDEFEKPLVSRVQLPLMLAWSLSIHKSQGQTLPRVKVDLRRVFEKGQAYVALSRAVSRAGLQVLNFNKQKVRAHDRVLEFYKTLTPAEAASKKFGNFTGKQKKLSFDVKRTNTPTPPPDRITALLNQKKKKKGVESNVEAHIINDISALPSKTPSAETEGKSI